MKPLEDEFEMTEVARCPQGARLSRLLPRDAVEPSTGVGPSCRVRLSGGLGNQLFQYAAGRSLSLRARASLRLDVSFYRPGRHRCFELGDFPNVSASIEGGGGRWGKAVSSFRTLMRRERVYREPHFHYDRRFESLRAPVTLEGYFQSDRYFRSHADIIRAELMPPRSSHPDWIRLSQEIGETESIVLHVRRGDYVTQPKAASLYAWCSPDYYGRALESLPSSGPVFVFTDDLLWARENLIPAKPLRFVGERGNFSAIEDLALMSLGHHHVIANSTFSWWGAWLAGPKKGMTIAPRTWFRDASIDDTDLIPTGWVRL